MGGKGFSEYPDGSGRQGKARRAGTARAEACFTHVVVFSFSSSFSPAARAAVPPSGARSGALDAVRGLLLVFMALNHVPIPPAVMPWLRQPVGVMTAAEGFVLIAGLLMGLIYTRKLRRDGPATAYGLLWRRAGRIYVAHLACLAGVFAWMGTYAIFWGEGQPPVGSPWALFEQPAAALGATILMLHQPGLLDVLPMYCGLVLITPLALDQLERGRAKGVLAVSAALWVTANLIDEPRPLIRGLLNTGAFNFGAWQFIYLAGLVAGHAWTSGRWPAWLRPSRRLFVGAAGGLAAFIALNHAEARTGLWAETWMALTNKNNVAPLRLLNVALVVFTVWCWIDARARKGSPVRSEWLALMGRHSLPVFSVHVVGALIILGVPTVFEWTRWGPWVGPAGLLAAMFVTARVSERLARRRAARKESAAHDPNPAAICLPRRVSETG